MTQQSPITAPAPLFITGLSGAGMSSALKVLEDLGYEVFDNFPLKLLDALMEGKTDDTRPIAIGIDTRTRGFDPQAIIAKVRETGGRLLLVTCDEAVLQKRFSETRRKHPLAGDRPVSAGIKKEMALLYDLRQIADSIIDTTELSIHDLRRIVTGLCGERTGKKLSVTILSFGFKNGLPREADIVMDVRFLQNPHWEEKLKPLTGKDGPVQAYIAKDPAFAPFLSSFQTMLEPLLGRYMQEGKSYLTLALGCTGGKHRSVYVAEEMGKWVQQKDIACTVEHRDIFRV
ncbi:MAG: RNase adapter RapZ [Micavibrio sp.]